MEDQIRSFLKFLKLENGYAENTLIAYQNDLRQFLRYVLAQLDYTHIKNWSEIEATTLFNYTESIKNNGTYTSSTVARKIAALKSFFHFLIAQNELKEDPTVLLDSPKVKKRLPRALTPLEIDQLLQAPFSPENSPKSKRDLALLEMLYASGTRVTELVSLDMDDIEIDENSGSVWIRKPKSNIREREIPISGPALDALRYYIEYGRGKFVRDQDEESLFVNNRGQRLTRQGLWLIIKHYVKTSGISAEITPHMLRHSFAAHKLSQGKSLQDIQKLLGHANISTTQIYTQVQQDNIKEVIYDEEEV